MLEPYAGKLARPVLRGGSGGDAAPLPDPKGLLAVMQFLLEINMTTKRTKATLLTPLTAMESPFARLETKKTFGASAPPAHTYGAASLQTYANGQVAFNTHASADGFLAYVNQFEQTSFRVKDAQVKWWQ